MGEFHVKPPIDIRYFCRKLKKAAKVSLHVKYNGNDNAFAVYVEDNREIAQEKALQLLQRANRFSKIYKSDDVLNLVPVV